MPTVITEPETRCPDCFAPAGRNCYPDCPNRYEPPDIPEGEPDDD